MNTAALRQLNYLEERLYTEMMEYLLSLLNNLHEMPSRVVAREATEVSSLFAAIGFVPTEIGPMMRIEDDIYDMPQTDAFMGAVQADMNQAFAAMGRKQAL